MKKEIAKKEINNKILMNLKLKLVMKHFKMYLTVNEKNVKISNLTRIRKLCNLSIPFKVNF